MIWTCPFCKSDNVIPVTNSTDKHWMFCQHCRASGPHCDTREEAGEAFKLPTMEVKRKWWR